MAMGGPSLHRGPGAARGQVAARGGKVQVSGIEGVVVRGHSNIHQVAVDGGRVDCYLRGTLRRLGRVVVGDRVRISLLEGERGVIEEVLERTSLLERPPVANAQQAVLVFSLRDPVWNQLVLDRMLLAAERQELRALLCLNKVDLLEEDPAPALEPYRGAGYPVVVTSARTGLGIKELANFLAGHMTVLAGASGVGKSSILNAVAGADLPTGEVGAIGRGRHTTRRVELISLPGEGFAADTPGFSTLTLGDATVEELGALYPDFRPYLERCRFRGCLHLKEPGCAVRQAVEEGLLDAGRYRRYGRILGEVQRKRHRQ
ncbi:MAG: ribosome small subunit-dependent GTPase A [Thermaerobacter sp.]|nr:ribosome small subunit-dependent GTPase A [Thermaerobacter sp.]